MFNFRRMVQAFPTSTTSTATARFMANCHLRRKTGRSNPWTEARFASLNGRPTDPCFPYYNLDWKGQGVIVVLGWPGQWSSSFTSDAEGNVHVSGGQELTHLALHPGEEVRSPRMVMLFWRGGNWIDARTIGAGG